MPTQTELEFRAAGGGQSQNERLRDYLRLRPGVWVAMPELAKVISPTGIGAAVHSRVADCRRKFEMVIEQRGGRDRVTGVYVSFYRFVPNNDGDSGPVESKENIVANPG